MWIRSKRWMHLAVCAGLVMGVACFVGCGGSDSGDGDSGSGSGDTNADGGGGGGDSGGGSADNGNGQDANPGGADNPGGDNTGHGGTDTPGTNGGAAVSIDHSTPEGLFDSMLDAARAQDYKAVAECYAPSIQRDMAVGMVSMAATADVNPMVKKEDLLPVLERHGITEADLPSYTSPQMQSQLEALADGIDNLTGFLGDMMSTLPDVAQGFTNTFGDSAVNATKLSDVEIIGDNASAQITAGGQSSGDEQRVKFVRIDGSWYVSG